MAMDNFEQADISGIDVCLTDNLPREMSQIETYQERLDQAYRNIGKLYAKLHWHSAEPIMLPYLNTVAECTSAISNIKRKQADSRNNMFCPACGAHISSTSQFCPHCGQNIQSFLRQASGAMGANAAAVAGAAPVWQAQNAQVPQAAYAQPAPAANVSAQPAASSPLPEPAASAPGTAPGNDQFTDIISHHVISIDDGTSVLSGTTPGADDGTTVIGANGMRSNVASAPAQEDPANLTNVIDLIDFEGAGESVGAAQDAAAASGPATAQAAQAGQSGQPASSAQSAQQ